MHGLSFVVKWVIPVLTLLPSINPHCILTSLLICVGTYWEGEYRGERGWRRGLWGWQPWRDWCSVLISSQASTRGWGRHSILCWKVPVLSSMDCVNDDPRRLSRGSAHSLSRRISAYASVWWSSKSCTFPWLKCCGKSHSNLYLETACPFCSLVLTLHKSAMPWSSRWRRCYWPRCALRILNGRERWTFSFIFVSNS